MGSLPPVIDPKLPEKFPAARSVQFTVKAKTASEHYDWMYSITDTPGFAEYFGLIGPMPALGAPALVDGRNVVDADFPASDAPHAPPWDGPRKLDFWDKVEYDYSTDLKVGATVTGGTGPHVRDETSGQIFVSAPPDRPLPYVTWFEANLLAFPFFDDLTAPGGYWTQPYIADNGSTYTYADNTPIVGSPVIGVARYQEYDTAESYKMVAGSFTGLILAASGLSNDPRTIAPFLVSGFGFDVVPPGETYALHVGWNNGNFNDVGIVAQEVGSVAYLSGIAGGEIEDFFSNLAQYQINSPRFGVMSF